MGFDMLNARDRRHVRERDDLVRHFRVMDSIARELTADLGVTVTWGCDEDGVERFETEDGRVACTSDDKSYDKLLHELATQGR